MWQRLSAILMCLAWPGLAIGQGDTTTLAWGLTTTTQRCSLPIAITESDARVRVSWVLQDAEQRDPTHRSGIVLQVSADAGQSWQAFGGAETTGSAVRDVRLVPDLTTRAPPAGTVMRACVHTVSRTATVGLILTALQGVRRVAMAPGIPNSVAFDATDTIVGNLVNSVTTATFTIAGSDRMCAVGSAAIGATPTTATCGGQTATAAGATVTNVSRTARIYCAIAPATGSQSATVNYDNSDGSPLVVTGASFTGADQTTPCADYTTATGTSETPSVTVTNVAADDFVFDTVAHGDLGSAGAGQTVNDTILNGSGSSRQDGVDGGVMSWSAVTESLAWAHAGVRVVTSAGGGGGSTACRNLLILGVGGPCN